MRLTRIARVGVVAGALTLTVGLTATPANAAAFSGFCGWTYGTAIAAHCDGAALVLSNNGSTMTVSIDCTLTAPSGAVFTDVVCYLVGNGNYYTPPYLPTQSLPGVVATANGTVTVPSSGSYYFCIAGDWYYLVLPWGGHVPQSCVTF